MEPMTSNPQAKGQGSGITWLRNHANYSDPKCLTWLLYRLPNGYGMLGYLGRRHYAHRLMCELAHGEPPTPKHEAAHKCGNGHLGCVNPRHLAWRTKQENRRESTQHGRGGRHCYGNKGKLTAEDVAKICELRGKMRQTDIAEQFGVSWQTISGIFCGRHKYSPQRNT